MADHPVLVWCTFVAIVALILAVQLNPHRSRAASSVRDSIIWTAAVIGLAAHFGGVLWFAEGREQALRFATGYVVELSLSVDNLLVFIIVLRYFAVPRAFQPTALRWGILGAIVLRGIVIGAGTLVITNLGWVIYVLGVVLIYTGAKLIAEPAGGDIDVARNPLLRAVPRVVPITRRFAGPAFFIREGGRRVATPLLLVVLVIEWTDLVFATDSIPAIFAITRDPFLVYTSNILAIIGLRALFFVVADAIERVAYLRYGVAAVLILVGMKMLAERWVAVPTVIMLATVIAILGGSIVLSRLAPRR
jgi:tellurite resistance protein TerC